MFINDGFPTLFIQDILLHTKLLSTVKPGWFSFKNMCFKSVRIRGTISEVVKFPDKWKIVVDDGTGTIVCYYMNYEKELDKRNKVWKLRNKMQNQTDSGVIPMLNNCLDKMQFVVHEYKVGETVEIVGNLREYQDNEKLIFASRLVIDKNNDVNKEVEYVRGVNHFCKEMGKLF